MKIKVQNISFTVSEKPVGIQDELMIDFWRQYSEKWEQYTFNVLNKFLDKDHPYIDIGAWMGPTALYGGQIAKESYCFEPDRMALVYFDNNLKENPEFSDKIKVFDYGIGSADKKERFYVGKGSTSMASTKPNHVNVDSYYDVQFYNIETAIAKAHINFKEVNFIKIDIEGGEYDLVPSLLEYLNKVQHFPALYISLHAPFLFSPIWKKSIFHKLLAYLPKKIMARFHNRKIIALIKKTYPYIYLPSSKPLTSLSQLGDARAFQEIVAITKPW